MSREVTTAQIVGRFGTGGAAKMAQNLALALRERGVRSLAIAVRAGGAAEARAAGLEAFDLGVGSAGGVPAGVLRLRRLIRRQRIDVLHVHGQPTLVLAYAACAGLRRRPRICFTWHNSEPIVENRLNWRDAPSLWAARRCELVYAASRQIAEAIASHPRVGRRVRVFRNGVARCPASRRVEADVPVLLWAARFTPTKDPAALIRVAGRLRADGLRFRLLMAGAAPPELSEFVAETRQLARQAGVWDILDLPGWVEAGDLLPQQAAIGVQTSLMEGLSITLLEQMMAGLAVVATDVGDTSEAVVDNVTGLLVKPQDDESLYQALRRLITDLPLRRRLGEAARRMAWEHFSLQAMAERAALDYGLPLESPDVASARLAAAPE